jgi:hypothetical protein|tara:strand:- start:532 stop:822 length:291 start_codon:yes stop_codon:yes gene_type:complete
MSFHAKVITKYKDSIPKLLFLTAGKLTRDFENVDTFVSKAHLDFQVDDKTFIFDFKSDDDKTISTKFQILDEDGNPLIGMDGIQDPMGPPINETIN